MNTCKFLTCTILTVVFFGCSTIPSIVRQVQPTANDIAQTSTITPQTLNPAAPHTPNLIEATIEPLQTSTHVPEEIVVTKKSLPATPTLTPTKLATYPIDKARVVLSDFLKTNGSCSLPCLWGLSPIESTTSDFKEFVEQFGSPNLEKDIIINSDFFKDVGGTDFQLWNGNERSFITFEYWQSDDQIKILRLALSMDMERGTGEHREFVPIYGGTSFRELSMDLEISRILSKYGKPTDVFILPFPKDYLSSDDYPSLFSVVLFYPEKGFFVEYIQPRREKGNQFAACLSEAGNIAVDTWDPARKLTFNDVAQYTGGIGLHELNVGNFKTLNAVTSLTVDEFYQIFIEPNNNRCIETQKNKWPEIQ